MRYPKLPGIVIYSAFTADDLTKGYGFIRPTSSGSDVARVWFGSNAAKGVLFERGDIVSFAYRRQSGNKGISASRVWLKSKAVEGIHNEQTRSQEQTSTANKSRDG